jgi:nicotinamidase-related amidase
MKTMDAGGKALLVIDMLDDFLREGAPLEIAAARAIVPAVRRRIAAARKKGELVVYVCDAHKRSDPEFARMGWPPHAIEGTPGSAVVSALSPEPGDVVVEKRSYSGFWRTGLDAVLKRHGIQALELCGCATNICVLHTAADAAMRGYALSVDSARVAGLDPATHDFALDHMERVLGVRVRREGRVSP